MTTAYSKAAPVVPGAPTPGGSRCDHAGDVLIMTAEDGVADTVRPLLDAESGGWAITVPQIGAEVSSSEGNLPQLARPGSGARTA
jgi:hypothetical protein